MKQKIIYLLLSSIIFYSYSYYIPYQNKLKQIETKNFKIIFPENYVNIAKIIANYSEEIYSKLSIFFEWKPEHKIIIVLTNHTQFPNGFASTYERNTVYLFLAQLDLSDYLKDFSDPLYSLILHELTHIFHLDQIRDRALIWNMLFGKIYFPVAYSFDWYIEGTAVLSESIFSDNGRLDNIYIDSIIKRKILTKKLPLYNELINPIYNFPFGLSIYFYGGKFLQFLYNNYGEEKFKKIFINLSKNFIPIYFNFVYSFKQIYNKSLKELWLEWINYEYNKQLLTINNNSIQLTKLSSYKMIITNNNDYIYFYSGSYENDSYIYSYNLKNKNITKIIRGNYRSISLTNNDNFILFTKNITYLNNIDSFDLFSYNIKEKKEKQLTFKKNINYISFSNNSCYGIIVSHNPEKSFVYYCYFNNNNFYIIKEIKIPDQIKFIYQPSLYNNKIYFSARLKNNTKDIIFSIDIKTNEIIQFQEINGINPKQFDDNNIYFINNLYDKKINYICKYNFITKKITKIFTTNNTIIDFTIINNKIYYLDYTDNGIELFETDLDLNNEQLLDINNDYNKKIEKKEYESNKNFIIKDYNCLEYLYPAISGAFPYQIGSYVYYNNIYIPFISLKFYIINSTPTERFNYSGYIGYNYFKNYPDNNLNLNFKLPNLNISYSWNNWAGGSYNYIKNKFISKKYKNIYPVNINNYLGFYSWFNIYNYGSIYFYFNINHHFQQYNFDINKPSNTLSFYSGFGYSYYNNYSNNNRANNGFSFSIHSIIIPEKIFDNKKTYILKTEFNNKIYINKNIFYFQNIYNSIDLLLNNKFSINNEFISIFGLYSFDSKNNIDIKAFSNNIINYLLSQSKQEYGFFYLYYNSGFDISIYKKTYYFNFLTAGFKEFYIKIFTEYLYLNNSNKYYIRNIYIDGVIEFNLNLFCAYGIIDVYITNGYSIGYKIFNKYPSFGMYLYLVYSLNT